MLPLALAGTAHAQAQPTGTLSESSNSYKWTGPVGFGIITFSGRACPAAARRSSTTATTRSCTSRRPARSPSRRRPRRPDHGRRCDPDLRQRCLRHAGQAQVIGRFHGRHQRGQRNRCFHLRRARRLLARPGRLPRCRRRHLRGRGDSPARRGGRARHRPADDQDHLAQEERQEQVVQVDLGHGRRRHRRLQGRGRRPQRQGLELQEHDLEGLLQEGEAARRRPSSRRRARRSGATSSRRS